MERVKNNDMERFILENQNKYLFVYSDCIPVQGKNKTAIYDLTRKDIFFIPNDYYPLFALFRSLKLGEIQKLLETKNDELQFISLIEFLLKNELAEINNDISQFPQIQERFEYHGMIRDAIIDIGDHIHDFHSIFRQLRELGCLFVQIRFFKENYTLLDLSKIVRLAYHKSIFNVSIYN